MKKQLEQVELYTCWVAYKKVKSLQSEWDDVFDTRNGAIKYLKDCELKGNGRVACQVECDIYKDGMETITLFAYGSNKREALGKLKKQAEKYGCIPVDLFNV